MSENGLLIALGIPAGKLIMRDGQVDGQVMYGNEVWHTTPEEYDQWNAVRLHPCLIEQATSIARELLDAGALYCYDPATPDEGFMQHHRVAPMGHPVGPSGPSLEQYQIVSTNARRSVLCDSPRAQIWLGWWQRRPLSQHPDATDEAVWHAIPWAISQELGYLTRWEGR